MQLLTNQEPMGSETGRVNELAEACVAITVLLIDYISTQVEIKDEKEV